MNINNLKKLVCEYGDNYPVRNNKTNQLAVKDLIVDLMNVCDDLGLNFEAIVNVADQQYREENLINGLTQKL